MPQPPQRILCIAFTHLPTDRIARQKWGKSWLVKERPATPPIVVTDTVKNAIRVIALESCASKLGIHEGQTLADARALVPDLECHTHNAADNHALLLSIAKWCERYTPLIAIHGNDALFMDITGCAHLFGGEQGLLEDFESRLKAQGFSVRLCLADTPGAAWAMAHYGTQRLLDPDDHAKALLDLPLASLRLNKNNVAALKRVGLKTIGCIANLPRAPLAARFGKELLQRLDQALGRESEAISPIAPVADLSAEKRFADPVVYEDDIKQIIQNLAENIIPTLEQRGLGSRECCIKLFRTDGNVSALTVQSARPLRDAKQIANLFNERLAGLHDDFDIGFGFDLVRLEILRSDPFDMAQGDLVSRQVSDEGYNALIDRLGARLGTDRVQSVVIADTHIPERSFDMVPVSRCVSAGTGKNAALTLGNETDTITRPLILLDRPEPIDTIAQVPDGPPLRFRWRRVSYEIARSEGPERIACEWWQDGRATRTRDYYRVEDKQGYRFWLFRHGLYERETHNPQWYMQGLFA